MKLRLPVASAIIFVILGFAHPAQADSSGPLGQWYVDANGFPLSVTISSPTPGAYAGTLVNESGGTETLDNITWGDSSRTLQFRRNGAGFWQWYSGTVVEGILVGRFSHDTTSSQKPAQLTSYQWHVTGWNSTYLDTAATPRVWELLIENNDLARLRIDRGSDGLIGRLKVYSTLSNAAYGEQIEYDLDAISWDGTNLSFTQHLDAATTRTFQGAVSGRTISGSYSPGAGTFSGTRAEVLTFGVAPKSVSARDQWIQQTRRRLYHLMMADNPQPLSRSVTVLNSNVAPTASVSLPPDRDDNPATWPQSYTMQELRFDYSLPNPYGGAPVARSSHAYLVTPSTPPSAGGKYPALLAVNGHGGSAWKMMDPDDVYFWYGDAYARRGFVVLAVDISHRPLEDRANLYNDYTDGDDSAHGNGTHPAVKATGFDSDWEEDGERSWDAMRALDYLLSLSNVDPNHVVVSGLSLGGEVTGITGGLDSRLSMSIPAGFSPDEGVMLYNGNHPCWQWQHADIREYVDASDYFALTAPRPLIIETGKVDYTFSAHNPPFSSDKQVVCRTLAAYNSDRAQCNLYLHYDQHHYHVGDINPTLPTDQGVRVPDQITPAQSGDLSWQTNSSTHTLQPTLFAAITSSIIVPDFLLSASTGQQTITAGQSASWTLSVTPSGGFNSSVSFTCTNLPVGATCTTSPAALQPDGTNVATTQVTISTATRSVAWFDLNRPGNLRLGMLLKQEHLPFILCASFLCVSFLLVTCTGLVLRRRIPGRAWLAPAVMLLLGSLSFSCGGAAGGGKSSGTPAGTYAVTVTAATNSGSPSHNTSLVLIVQ